jgi:Na+/H+-dicarboxylate symporter
LTNPAAPASPFAMPRYHSAQLARATRLQKQADDLFNLGQRANDISDRFVRGTVLLAVALFFGGIAQTFKSTTIKAVLVGMAFLVCVASALMVAHLPMLSLNL